MSKKIILFLVEGPSDREALFAPLGLLINSIDKNLDVDFLIPINERGDITGNPSITQKDVVKKIVDWWGVNEYLSRNGLTPTDIYEIIHIIDVDGVYIPDSKVIYAPIKERPKYYDEFIKCSNKPHVIERNKRKKYNITKLKSLNSLPINGSSVAYSIYYFSCNMDHFLLGERNLDYKLKIQKAEEFAYSFNSPEDVDKIFHENSSKRKNILTGYKQSWEYISDGFKSLSPCSNIGIFIDRLKKRS